MSKFMIAVLLLGVVLGRMRMLQTNGDPTVDQNSAQQPQQTAQNTQPLLSSQPEPQLGNSPAGMQAASQQTSDTTQQPAAPSPYPQQPILLQNTTQNSSPQQQLAVTPNSGIPQVDTPTIEILQMSETEPNTLTPPPNCQTFDGVNCSECVDGATLVDGACEIIPVGCATYNKVAGKCEECDPGLTLAQDYNCE